MFSTQINSDNRTQVLGADGRQGDTGELIERYNSLISERRTKWTTYHRFERMIGKGGQGLVFLSHRRGTDGFTVPIAMKVFSPETFSSQTIYEEDMRRVGSVAAGVARIQHDNVLQVQDFVDRNRIRLLIMEWIDGYDIRRLLSLKRLVHLGESLPADRWRYINSVIITPGTTQSRFKAGVAVAIVRDCLAGLASLHKNGIIHGDVKPANIMIKRSGMAKLIDIGSAFFRESPPTIRMCSPTYAAPEVIENTVVTPRSDLASLGYCLVEMLAGRQIFEKVDTVAELLKQKRELPRKLSSLLPDEVTRNELLMKLCRGLIAPDPTIRFPSAEAADLLEDGAASFHRQLVLSNLSSEYDHDLQIWMEEMQEYDEILFTDPTQDPSSRPNLPSA